MGWKKIRFEIVSVNFPETWNCIKTFLMEKNKIMKVFLSLEVVIVIEFKFIHNKDVYVYIWEVECWKCNFLGKLGFMTALGIFLK